MEQEMGSPVKESRTIMQVTLETREMLNHVEQELQDVIEKMIGSSESKDVPKEPNSLAENVRFMRANTSRIVAHVNTIKRELER